MLSTGHRASRLGRPSGIAAAGLVFRCLRLGPSPKPVPDCVFPEWLVGDGETGLRQIAGRAGFGMPRRSAERPGMGRKPTGSSAARQTHVQTSSDYEQLPDSSHSFMPTTDGSAASTLMASPTQRGLATAASHCGSRARESVKGCVRSTPAARKLTPRLPAGSIEPHLAHRAACPKLIAALPTTAQQSLSHHGGAGRTGHGPAC